MAMYSSMSSASLVPQFSQHHPVLLLIERNVLLPGIGHVVQTVHQAVDDLAAQNGLFQDLVAVLGP